MVHNVSGFLISLEQMHEMASYKKPVTELVVAYQVLPCRSSEVPGSLGACRLPTELRFEENLVLYEHFSEEKIDAKKSNRTKLARTAREWLKACGVSGTDSEKIKFVTTEDPFYY